MSIMYLGVLSGAVSSIVELVFMILGILCFIKYLKRK